MCGWVRLVKLNSNRELREKNIVNRLEISRRTFASVAAMTAASWVAPLLGAQPRLEKTKMSLAVGDKASFYYLPLTIAEQLGYFRDEGLEVEISDLASDARVLQAVISGSTDVVSGAFDHTINLQSKGQKFQAFVLQGRAPAVCLGVSLKNLPDYRTATDLRGKKIGISAQGSSTHMVASRILSGAGLKASEVSFIAVGAAASALSAFRAGQIDALSHGDPVMTMLEQKTEIRIIGDTRTLKGTLDLFGGVMPAGCLYASLEFIQKYPNTVQALTHAMVRSLKWLQTAGPGDIINAVPEAYLLGDRALYLAAFNKGREAISPDGLMPEEGPPIALKMLTSFDPMIKVEQIEISRTYTNEFANKAKKRFKA